jgi:hypothetical protein
MAPIEKELIGIIPGLEDGMRAEDGMEQIIVHIKNLEHLNQLERNKSRILMELADLQEMIKRQYAKTYTP